MVVCWCQVFNPSIMGLVIFHACVVGVMGLGFRTYLQICNVSYSIMLLATSFAIDTCPWGKSLTNSTGGSI